MSHINAGANLQKEGTTCLKKLTKRIMTFDYGKLLLFKSPQNKLTSNVEITGKKETQIRHIIHATGILDKTIDFTDETLIQCEVPTVKHISWDDNNFDGCK